MEPLNSHSPNHGDSQAWGADALSTFVDIAHANARRSFTYDRERCEALVEVDSLYRQVLSNLSGSGDQLACALLVRSHGLYLGAVSLALSGMIAECYGLLNRSLKTALQGVFVAGNSTRQQLWSHRDNNEAMRGLMQAEFKTEKMRRHLRSIDPSTSEICEKLMRRTRDHADHPNTYADPSKGAGMKDGRLDVDHEYFVGDDDVQRYCLRSAAQVGICCLTMFFYVYPDQYRDAGIPDRLTALRHGH